MTVYQTSGNIAYGSGSFTSTITGADSINPFTGGTGVKVLKLDCINATNSYVVDYTPLSTTWDFANVAATGGTGSGATFNVSDTSGGYVVTINDPGTEYTESDTLTIDGSLVGGETTTNDITITVTSVDADGLITGITSSGTQVWPINKTGQFICPPNTTSFVQVTSGTISDGVYLSITGEGGFMYLAPVTVVG